MQARSVPPARAPHPPASIRTRDSTTRSAQPATRTASPIESLRLVSRGGERRDRLERRVEVAEVRRPQDDLGEQSRQRARLDGRSPAAGGRAPRGRSSRRGRLRSATTSPGAVSPRSGVDQVGGGSGASRSNAGRVNPGSARETRSRPAIAGIVADTGRCAGRDKRLPPGPTPFGPPKASCSRSRPRPSPWLMPAGVRWTALSRRAGQEPRATAQRASARRCVRRSARPARDGPGRRLRLVELVGLFVERLVRVSSGGRTRSRSSISSSSSSSSRSSSRSISSRTRVPFV